MTEEALAYAIDEMHKHIGEENIAAVIMEPIQGEGGFIVPSPGFVKGIAEFCAAHGIVFIADEIQSGMGRAGRWFAIEDEDVVPDVVTTAKSVGGGMPISAVTGRVRDHGRGARRRARRHVRRQPRRGRRLARGARHDRARGPPCRARGRSARRSWSASTAFAQRYEIVGDVRGRGSMCAIELVADRDTKEPLDAETMNAIARRCLEEGVLVLTAGTYGNVVRLLPPITIDDALLADGLDVLDTALGAVAG